MREVSTARRIAGILFLLYAGCQNSTAPARTEARILQPRDAKPAVAEGLSPTTGQSVERLPES